MRRGRKINQAAKNGTDPGADPGFAYLADHIRAGRFQGKEGRVIATPRLGKP